MVTTGNAPFGVAATPDGRWAFVATAGPDGQSVAVLRLAGTGAPAVVRFIGLPSPALGAAITPDGKYLLVADRSDGVTVLSVAKAEAGQPGAVLGVLGTPPRPFGQPGPGGGAIEVTTSPDGRFAFVTLEWEQRAAVYNLAAALAQGFTNSDYVGAIPLGGAPVGITVSPDGRWLYATSEISLSGWKARRPPVPAPRPTQSGPPRPPVPGSSAEPPGTLTVVDLRKAETDPARSVVATVAAGCEPVRVVTSGNGALVWVTARASDDLLGFAAARLATDPARALVSITRVGEAPVGLAAVAGGSLIVVADSNRFAASAAHADLTVVSVAAALSAAPAGSAGRGAVVGRIPAGLFPRDMALSPDGTLLVSNFTSGQLEAVDVASIPG